MASSARTSTRFPGSAMFPKRSSFALAPNSYGYKSPAAGEAHWLSANTMRAGCSREINLMGVEALGLGWARSSASSVRSGDRHRPRLPRLFRFRQGRARLRPDEALQGAINIGLALARWQIWRIWSFDVPCVAMVTASHNDNGWSRGAEVRLRPSAHLRPQQAIRGHCRGHRARCPLGRAWRRPSFGRGFYRPLHCRPDQAAEAQAQAQGRV